MTRYYFIPTENNPAGDVFEQMPVPDIPGATFTVNRTAYFRTMVQHYERLALRDAATRVDVGADVPGGGAA